MGTVSINQHPLDQVMLSLSRAQLKTLYLLMFACLNVSSTHTVSTNSLTYLLSLSGSALHINRIY